MTFSNLYIRTDADQFIGHGHITRCLALAEIIKNKFKIIFICKSIPDNTALQIKKQFQLKLIDKEDDFINQIKPLEIVVIDGYSFDEKYQKELKNTGCKLVCIDDLSVGYFYADLVINYGPSVSIRTYNSEPYTKFALGLDYALLRPAFLKQAIEQRNPRYNSTVMICFGGSDPKNNTLKALQTVLKCSNFDRIIVVVGISYQYFSKLELFVKSIIKTVELHKNIDEKEMVDVMIRSDVAIIPSSGILLEAICCGIVPIIGLTASNQASFFDYFTKTQGVLNFGNNIEFFQENLLQSILIKPYSKNISLQLLREKIATSSSNFSKVFKDL